jgi:alcohol dehydrogenase (cytochrome c)
VLFAGENTGDLLAMDTATGKVLYRFNTGGAMTAGVVTYAVGGKQYVGAASGRGSFWLGGGKGSPTVVVFTLPAD